MKRPYGALEAAAEVRGLRAFPGELDTALKAGREAEQIFEHLAAGRPAY